MMALGPRRHFPVFLASLSFSPFRLFAGAISKAHAETVFSYIPFPPQPPFSPRAFFYFFCLSSKRLLASEPSTCGLSTIAPWSTSDLGGAIRAIRVNKS